MDRLTQSRCGEGARLETPPAGRTGVPSTLRSGGYGGGPASILITDGDFSAWPKSGQFTPSQVAANQLNPTKSNQIKAAKRLLRSCSPWNPPSPRPSAAKMDRPCRIKPNQSKSKCVRPLLRIIPSTFEQTAQLWTSHFGQISGPKTLFPRLNGFLQEVAEILL